MNIETEFTREYEVMPPTRILDLIIRGYTLETKCGMKIRSYRKDYPIGVIDARGEVSQFVGSWGTPFRVYVKPEKVAHWFFTNGLVTTNKKHTQLTFELSVLTNVQSVKGWSKVLGSEELLEMEETP